jgi:Bax protein
MDAEDRLSMNKRSAKLANRLAAMGATSYKCLLCVLAGVIGVLAIGVVTLKDAAGTSSHPKIVTTKSAEAAKLGVPRNEKSAKAALIESKHKLDELFRDVEYEIDGVHSKGDVPQFSLASLPKDFSKTGSVWKKKNTFIKLTLPLILHVNELIMKDRERLQLFLAQMNEGDKVPPKDLIWLKALYKIYDYKKADLAGMLKRVDIIPPSLAIAQAAEESGWGTSRFAREGNALFGQRVYKPGRTGIIPKERGAGKSFRVRSFDQLIDCVKAYAHNLNSHSAYNDFRNARSKLRAEDGEINGYGLAGALLRYSERGKDYIDTIRLIIRANRLEVFDEESFGGTDDPDA